MKMIFLLRVFSFAAVCIAILISTANCSPQHENRKWDTSPFGKDYYLRATGDNFFKSAAYCQRLGGRLAVIGSLHERQFLIERFGSSYQFVWIGAMFDLADQQFKWLDGAVDIERWTTAAQDAKANQAPCTALLMKGGELHSDRCSILVAGALCERPSTPALNRSPGGGRRKRLRDQGRAQPTTTVEPDQDPRDETQSIARDHQRALDISPPSAVNTIVGSECEAIDQINVIMRQFDGSFAKTVARVARQRARREGVPPGRRLKPRSHC